MITKEMGIAEVIRGNPDTVQVFRSFGMGCIGCVAARYESIEAGAVAHGIDVEALVKALNEVPAKSHP